MLRKKVLRCMCSHSFTVVLLCPCICPLWWVLGAQTCPVLYSRVLASSHCNAEYPSKTVIPFCSCLNFRSICIFRSRKLNCSRLVGRNCVVAEGTSGSFEQRLFTHIVLQELQLTGLSTETLKKGGFMYLCKCVGSEQSGVPTVSLAKEK
eukprot:1144356-Pelagomonas_calceolata.AAC.3